ncbi:MAG: PTS sugar transporter subunit IIC [Synergistaceae bacterium]|jgi:fructoselysine and glucoselysine-specific PTS system IIC component|nr:PTS sugar transporter subunit IIC [Synergistaceae bacterium]
MDSTLFQSVMLGIIAFFGYMHSFMGSTMHNRPIIMAPLVGLLFGDLEKGIMIGATLELIWMGAFPIGASNPPDMVSGAIIGSAFAINSGQDIPTAVAFAVPIASLVLVFDNFMMTFYIPFLSSKADKSAEQGDFKGVERMHLLALLSTKGLYSILVGLGFYLGADSVTKILSSIPQFVTDGLNVATGLLPAIGFAMLAKMIMTKRLMPFFLLGFLITSYMRVSVLGSALFAVVIALLLNFSGLTGTKEDVANDNEF